VRSPVVTHPLAASHTSPSIYPLAGLRVTRETAHVNRATRVVLIRHGESVSQHENRMPDAHDLCTGLSPLGRRQATALVDRLEKTKELAAVDVAYSSLSTRAIETAEQLTKVLSRPFVAHCDWCESHPGEAAGVSWAEFGQRFPARSSSPDAFERRIPGGESWAEFFARAGERLRRLAHDHEGKTIVVVTHGGVIGASFVAFADVPIQKAFNFTDETRNTSLTEWIHNGEWRLVRFNDFAHLATLPAGDTGD
jgi:probable phosphoglycerate mutase